MPPKDTFIGSGSKAAVSSIQVSASKSSLPDSGDSLAVNIQLKVLLSFQNLQFQIASTNCH